MKRQIIFLILLQLSNVGLAQQDKIPVRIDNSDKQCEFVGKLGVKFGSILTVRGIIVEGSIKGHESGPNLIVQMINDSAIQHLVQLPVSPFGGQFGTRLLPKLKYGATYILRVYEIGEFVGHSPDISKELGLIIPLQTAGFYFRNRLMAVSGEKTDPIEWSPINFVGQNALLSGTAKNENDTAVIQTSKWKLRLIGFRKWMDWEIGKPAEVYGKIEQTKVNGTYDVKNGQPQLVKLEDQLGKTVKLRGIAINSNQYWWFNYRGTDLYVEKMSELPNWVVDNHFRPMEITGILEQEEFPDRDQIGLKENPDRKLYYIIRKASWTPIKELLAPEIQF